MPNCADCSIDYPYLQKAHVVARHKGGPNEPENIVLICPNCHHLRDRDDRVAWMKKAWTPERRARQAAKMSEQRRTGLIVTPSQAEKMRAKADTNSPSAQAKRSASMKTAWVEGDWSERNEKVAVSMRGNKNGLGNKSRTAALAGRWSIAHDRCVECRNTTSPHKARGLCNACYMRYRR